MNTRRKNELLANTLEWMLETIKDDSVLYNTLHEVIGWQKSELHDFSIESLDEYFDEQEEETVDMITAEDLAEQLVYATFAPECCSPEERSENMLKMLGANIVNEDVFHDESDHLAHVMAIEAVVKYCVDHQENDVCELNDELVTKITNGVYTSPWEIDVCLEDQKAIVGLSGNLNNNMLTVTVNPDYINADESFTQSM